MHPPTSKKNQVVISNKVQEFCANKGISEREFMGLALGSPAATETGRQITFDTARRVWNGETGISMITAALFTHVLGAESISDLFDIL